jgi:hypothetical protein
MNKKTKIALSVGAIVIITGLAIAGSRSDLFQGKLNFKRVNTQGLYKNGQTPPKIVSVVTSPVSSVVVSNTTSQVGTSRVATKVASVVTSPVASAVPVSAALTTRVATSTLPLLTVNALKAEAKKYYLNNPAKFRLTGAQKRQILNLYNTKYKL